MNTLKKYYIGELISNEFPVYAEDTGFYRECQKRVGRYFKEKGLHHKDPVNGLTKLAMLILVMAVSYCVFNSVYFRAPGIILYGCAIIYGSCQALILLHMMHDASHTSIGYGPMWWKIIGKITMEWISGASFTSWYYQHVVGHHIYTNIMGSDPDLPVLEEGDLRYLVKRQIFKTFHKHQHIYMPILYAFLALKFRIQDLTDTFFDYSNGPIRVNPQPTSEWINLFASKLWYLLFRIAIPLYFFPVTWIEFFAIYFVIEFTTGYYLAFNFQVSHISTAAHFPLNDKYTTGKIDLEWAVSQVITSVDYSHGNKLTSFLSGALNYQSIHHLFPSVSQYYYPDIAPIVMEVCKEYDVPFNHIPTFLGALSAHINYMKDIAEKALVK